MAVVTVQGGKIVFRDGRAGSEQSCCCQNNECKFNEDCGEGRYCCDGTCQDAPCDPDCPTGFSSSGWWTAEGKQDFTVLLQNAGYTDVTWTPSATDGCGQTLYSVTASCCGNAFGCDPAFTTANVRGIAGPGNQFPPCGAADIEVSFVSTCCNPLP